jgi:hypothetical protein
MATGTGNFPNRPFRLRIEVWYNWQSGRTVSKHTEVWIDKLSYSPTYSGSGSAWQLYVDGVGNVANWSGGYDFRNGDNFLLHSRDDTITVGADGNSGAQIYAQYDTLGSTSAGATYDGADATVPSAPNTPTATNISTTGMTLNWNIPSDGGASIDSMLLRRYNSALALQNDDAAQRVDYGQGASTTSYAVTGLTPGTPYWWVVYAHNSQGYSVKSGALNQSTLPAVAPGMTITPTPSGLSSVATFSPPGGTSGVTLYTLEYRLGSTGAVTSTTTTSTTATVTGLTPGASYEYRGSANYGAYQSPWTAWTPMVQPNPSTSPGDFFDGATTATSDQTYRWTGTASNSTSEAVGHAPTGWLTFAQGSTTSGGTGVVAQVSDPQSGTKGARATFYTDATSGNFRIGPDTGTVGRTDVTAGASYVGTIFVKPSRSQRMNAELYWMNAAGTFISLNLGTPVVCPAGSWTQLTVIADSPPLAEWASIRALDVSGTGWSMWVGGDTITADAAMITLGAVPIDYFDGSYPDANGYVYSWMGDPNASASIREQVETSLSDDLIDPDCPPVPLPPRPPVISDPCITDVGLWRRYYAMIPASEVSDWLDVLPTFELRTYSLAERQVRIRIYPNPFNYPIGQIDTANWCAEQIISYIPATSVMTLDGELQRTFASVSGGPTVAADHLLYGTGGTPATWPVLSCGMSYLVSFDTPVGGTSPPPGNLTAAVTLTRRT